MIRKIFGPSPFRGAMAAVVLSIVLLVQAAAASAATLSEDMVQASKDACVNLARRRGFTVEQVVNAQPAGGDSASVVLKLMKAGEPYEFKCGFSQAIDHFEEPVPVATAQRNAGAQNPAGAQRPQATVTPAPAAPRAEVRPDVRRERAVVVDRSRQRQADVSTERAAKGGFNALWLLPLLLLPLAALLFRNKEEVAVTTTTPTRVSAPTIPSTVVEALLRTQDSAIEVRSGAGLTHAVTRTIPAGTKVRLSGRYENDWAELAESGWISVQSLTDDPRGTTVKSYSS